MERGLPQPPIGDVLKCVCPAVPPEYTCQPGRFAVVSELPIKRLTRATPGGVEQARRRARKLRRSVQFIQKLHAEKAHIGRASPEKSTGRTVSILTSGRSLRKAPAYGAAIAFSQSLKCRAKEAEPLRPPNCGPFLKGFGSWVVRAAASEVCRRLNGRPPKGVRHAKD
jgi:hypothetical protein